MMGNVFAFLRLSRPVFLGGGFVLYALGALVAYHQGIALDWRLYLVGQVAVTSIQLMTHYLNDYWDVDSDRLNNHRTLFSGGSGILASGELPRRVALWAALVCLAVGLAAILVLALAYRPGWVPLTVAAFMVAGAWSYSSPPLALESSGFGELATALIVSFLVPSLGFSLQLGTLDWMLVLASLPLVALNWAMVVAFHFPDFEADRGANKRTLLVRLGHGPAARLHALAVLGAYALLLASPALGVPRAPALLGALTLPLAAAVVVMVIKTARGQWAAYGWLTFTAVCLFALTALLEAAGFLLSHPQGLQM